MVRRFRDIEPRVDSSAYIDVSAQVIGNVVIGAESSIWMNVVVRGDVNQIRIGRRTNIQDLTMVHVMRGTHPTAVGDEVTVGHSAVIHGCTIEDRVLVGMAAVLLNGVRVGSDAVIAAGSLIFDHDLIGRRAPNRHRSAWRQPKDVSPLRSFANY